MSEPHCTHRPPCPGCPAFGQAMSATRAFEQLSSFCQVHDVTPGVLQGSPLGYRHRARLAVRGRAASPKVGIFQRGSHRIADIPQCPVHHPRINAVAAAVREAVRRTGTVPYADAPHRGLLRYLQVSVCPEREVVQLVLVLNAEHSDEGQPLVEALVEALGPDLHSLAINLQPDRGNAILGAHTEVIVGPPALDLRFGSVVAHFPPAAFMQNNLPVYGQLVRRLAGWVPDGERIVEYHAGVGAIGLGLVARSASVVFNEVSPASLAGLSMGIAALDDPLRARTAVRAGDAAAHLDALADATTVIADPPRRGLGPELTAALVERPPRQLVYVSCGLDSFQREAAVLQEGGLRLDEVVAVDLFPFTEHLETLARFSRT